MSVNKIRLAILTGEVAWWFHSVSGKIHLNIWLVNSVGPVDLIHVCTKSRLNC